MLDDLRKKRDEERSMKKSGYNKQFKVGATTLGFAGS